MPYERDVRVFDQRAATYDSGWLGRMHHEISGRVADLALRQVPAPRRVLDVGAGTGYLLNLLASRLPDADEFVGVDAAPSMVAAARARTADERMRFVQGTANGSLPITAATIWWSARHRSITGRTRAPASLNAAGRSRRAVTSCSRTSSRCCCAQHCLPAAAARRGPGRALPGSCWRRGLRSPQWHRVYAVIIQAVTAVR